MLHDTERNQKYYVALRDAVETMHARGLRADVLDIGTGTGLLSMMAVRCGADSVTACEAFTPMAECAKNVIEDNECTDKIRLIHKRSTDVTVGPNGDMPERANILVTEVFDTELIGEGAIGTFHHAHERLLQKDCIVVPQAANMYAQVIHSDEIQQWNQLLPVKVPGSGDIEPPPEIRDCPGAAAVLDLQMEQISQSQFTAVSNPIKVYRFDYSSGDNIQFSGESQEVVTAIASGRCDAVFMWWDLEMDTKNKVLLSCAPSWAHPEPDNLQWRDHWMQAIYFPKSRVNAEKGQHFVLRSSHDAYSLWFDVSYNGPETQEIVPPSSKEVLQKPNEPPACTCGAHIACSRQRIGMLNDQTRNEKYISTLTKKVTNESICLSLSDSSLLPLMAAKLGAKHVYALEPQAMSKRLIESYVKHNGLEDKVTILEKSADQVTLEDIGGQKADILLAEPYFYTSTLPWDNIYFWYARTDIADSLASSHTVIPCCATMKAVAVDFNDLWKIRAPVGKCEGFDLGTFDKLVENSADIADATVEPQPLWEYPGTPLTEHFALMHLDFTRPLVGLRTVERQGVIAFNSPGMCNGVAIWMDFYTDPKNLISTGLLAPPKPGNTLVWEKNQRQGVYLFKHPAKIINVGSGARLKYKVTFRPNSGEFEFKFSAIC